MNTFEKSLLTTSSQKMKDVAKLIDKIAETDINILITGEVGTGKELVAKIIHDESKRIGKFISIDPNDLNYRKQPEPELIDNIYDVFYDAKDGTIMIDDIASSSLKFQTILLLIMKNTSGLNVRIISCTTRNLKELSRQKRFDQALYDKLIIVHVKLPPLRERIDDILGLTNVFIKDLKNKYAHEKSISKEALDTLIKYDFPGNVRELEAIITHAYISSDASSILPSHFPNRIFERNSNLVKTTIIDDLYRLSKGLLYSGNLAENINTYFEYLKVVESPLIKAALDMTSDNVSKAAKLIKINRNTLAKKMKAYDIE